MPEAMARKVLFVPGRDFFTDGSGQRHMRLNFSNATPEQIRIGIGRLAAVCASVTQRWQVDGPATENLELGTVSNLLGNSLIDRIEHVEALGARRVQQMLRCRHKDDLGALKHLARHDRGAKLKRIGPA